MDAERPAPRRRADGACCCWSAGRGTGSTCRRGCLVAIGVLSCWRTPPLVPQWRYPVHRWEVTDTAVYTQTGWWARERRIAPMSRVQTVDYARGRDRAALRAGHRPVTTASSAGALDDRGSRPGPGARDRRRPDPDGRRDPRRRHVTRIGRRARRRPRLAAARPRGCCWSTRSASRPLPAGLIGVVVFGRSASGGGRWGLLGIAVPVALGPAALPDHQLPDHRRPGRAAPRAAQQAGALRSARPGPHRRRHGVPDPPPARPGHAADRHRAQRDQGRGPARARRASRHRPPRDLRTRLLHVSPSARPDATAAAGPSRPTRRPHPRPRVGAVRAVHLRRHRHRRCRAGHRRRRASTPSSWRPRSTSPGWPTARPGAAGPARASRSSWSRSACWR